MCYDFAKLTDDNFVMTNGLWNEFVKKIHEGE